MNRNPPVEASASCVAVREARSRGEALSPEAEVHAESCPVCQADPATPPDPAWDEDAAFASLTASLESERGLVARLREAKTSSRVLAATGLVFLVIAGFGFLRPRSRVAPMPVTRVLVVVSVLSVVLALAVRLVLRPLQSPPASRRTLFLSLVAGLALPFVFAGMSQDEHAAAALSSSALRCYLVGGSLGAAFMGLLFVFDRTELASRTTGFLAAAAGGLAANAALELHCSSTDPLHLMLGHATVGVALLALYLVRSPRSTS
jgi:hypothetical protein